jgi:hypothetical protein
VASTWTTTAPDVFQAACGEEGGGGAGGAGASGAACDYVSNAALVPLHGGAGEALFASADYTNPESPVTALLVSTRSPGDVACEVPAAQSPYFPYPPAYPYLSAVAALHDGRAFVANGNDLFYNGGTVLTQAAVFDGTTPSGSWSYTAPMLSAHLGGAAVEVPGYGVIVVGGRTGGALSGSRTAEWLPVLPSAHTTENVPWVSLPSMFYPRQSGHTATLLPDGTVLVIGGSSVSTAELFDPSSGSWTTLESAAGYRFSGHESVSLDDGRVLVIGGALDGAQPQAILCDPRGGTWEPQPASPGLTRRAYQASVPLAGGSLLSAGGKIAGPLPASGGAPQVQVALDDAVVFDSAKGVWVDAGTMSAPRVAPLSAQLPDGRVLVAGGDVVSCENPLLPGDTACANVELQSTMDIFDPSTATWTPGSRPASLDPLLDAGGGNLFVGPQNVPVANTTVTLSSASLSGLAPASDAGQEALLIGSVTTEGLGVGYLLHQTQAFAFTPAGAWAPVAKLQMVNLADGFLAGFTATRLLDGTVLVAGGVEQGTPSDAGTGQQVTQPAEATYLVSASKQTWVAKRALTEARHSHTATLLRDGRVLVVGGRAASGSSDVLTSCELYDPGAAPGQPPWTTVAPLNDPRYGHQAVLLGTGHVLVAGGLQSAATFVASAELYDPVANHWSVVRRLRYARAGHALAEIDGGVLAIGGENALLTVSAVERFPEGNDGDACLGGTDCTSGYCVTGVCCDSACDDAICHACSRATGASQDGTCDDISVSKCGALACVPAGGGCQPCVTQGDCAAGLVCDPSGDCVAPPPDQCGPAGATCSAALSASEPGPYVLSGLVLAAGALVTRRRSPRRPRAGRSSGH